MPLTFSIPDTVLSTTIANYERTLRDNIFRQNVYLSWLLGNTVRQDGQTVGARNRVEMVPGGESLVVPLLYAANSTAQAYSGYELLDTTPQDGITAAKFIPKQYSVSVSISGREDRQNRSEYAIVNLLEAKMGQAESSLRQLITNDLFSTNQDSAKGFLGLQAIADTASASIGGISQSSNTWWRSYVKTSAGSFATNGLNELRTAILRTTFEGTRPDLIIMAQDVFGWFMASVDARERIVDTEFARAGFEAYTFQGIPVTWDAGITSGQAYVLTSSAIVMKIYEDANFTSTPFVKPANQDARVSQILVMGEHCVREPRRLAKITGFTA